MKGEKGETSTGSDSCTCKRDRNRHFRYDVIRKCVSYCSFDVVGVKGEKGDSVMKGERGMIGFLGYKGEKGNF